MNYLTRIESLHPDIIDEFVESGVTQAIPIELQQYIFQIQWGAEVWNSERNITRAAQVLKRRIWALQQVKMPLRTCKARINDAINYFTIDSTVGQKVWDLDTADKLEDLAKLSIADNRFKEAHKMMLDANDLRRRASEMISAEDLKAPVFLIDIAITAQELGFEKKNKKDIARKANDGFYQQLISELPIEKGDKKRLMRDASIEDVSFEDIPNE